MVDPQFNDPNLSAWNRYGNVQWIQYSDFSGSLVPPPSGGPNAVYLAPSGGDVGQSIVIDQGCAVRPFRLTYWRYQYGGGGVTMQFTNADGNIGWPYTFYPDDTDLSTRPYPMEATKWEGTVPADATGVTITFSNYSAVIDIVDFTICS